MSTRRVSEGSDFSKNTKTTRSETITITGINVDNRSEYSEQLSVKDCGIELQNIDNLEIVKHTILTEKAKMNLKPNIPTACRDYMIMRAEENDFKAEIEWDSSEHNLMRDIIWSKSMYAYAQAHLNNRRAENALTRKNRRQRIEELKRGEREFGASFIHYNTFIKENVEKRERALEKVQGERFIQADIEEQILQTEIKIRTYKQIKDNMLRYIYDRNKFVSFMEKVRLLGNEQFPNGVQEIVERFELLLSVREGLANQQANSVRMMQELSNKVFHMTDERTEELTNLRNKVTELRCRLDVAKHDALYWTSIVNRVEEVTARQSRQLHVVKAACWHLYLKICKQHQITVILKRHETTKQLSEIEKTIKILRRALLLIKKKGFASSLEHATSDR